MPASSLGRLLARLGPEVDDSDEETFLFFSHERPAAQNLGFIDAHASIVDVTVAGRDLSIHQSPAVLTSNRAGGTTGAVLWKITPVVADWLARPGNVFFSSDGHGHTEAALLGPRSAILELGCGISGVIGLALTGKGSRAGGGDGGSGGGSAKKRVSRASARRGVPTVTAAAAPATAAANTVARYVLTDQSYVAKFLQRNLDENGTGAASAAKGALYFRPLDWETDEVTTSLLRSADEASKLHAPASFDAVLACDCIYNEALIAPLVQTCADACRLRLREAAGVLTTGSSAAENEERAPTVCIVAQQLRDPDMLTAWLAAFHDVFRVWRVPEALLTPELRPTAGFAVHVGILRES